MKDEEGQRQDFRQALTLNFELEKRGVVWRNPAPASGQTVGYPSGQRGQTVNLLAYAFDGSNPSPTTISGSGFAEIQELAAEAGRGFLPSFVEDMKTDQKSSRIAKI